MAPKNSGAQASTKPCGWKCSKPGQVTVLEDQLGDAERGGDRGQVGDDADERDQRAAEGDRAAAGSRAPMSSPKTSGVRADSAFSRSWFSAAAPPTSEPARQFGAQPVDGGAGRRRRGVGGGDGQRHRPAVGACRRAARRRRRGRAARTAVGLRPASADGVSTGQRARARPGRTRRRPGCSRRGRSGSAG